jgi:hypothetical protein
MIKLARVALRTALMVAAGAVVFAATPAVAASPHGETAPCTVINPNRFQCNFSAVAPGKTLQIQYVSMQCGSTGAHAFSLQEFQVLTTPPNSNSEVAYQIPITNQGSLMDVVSAGSPVELYAKPESTPRALIDLTPAPAHPGTQCTVSLSGLITP